MSCCKTLQLDFFSDEDTMITQHKLMRLDETVSRVRKGLYARSNFQERQLKEMREELEFLKRMICRNELSGISG